MKLKKEGCANIVQHIVNIVQIFRFYGAYLWNDIFNLL